MTDETPPGGKLPRKPRLPREISERRRLPLTDREFRDLTWAMKLPFVRVSPKNKGRADLTIRFKDDGESLVVVTVLDPQIGMATILDWDIIIFAVSVLMVRANTPGGHQVDTFNRVVKFRPNDLLATIRRAKTDGGTQINKLEGALKRLMNTHVRLQIGTDFRDERKFTLLDGYHRGQSTADELYPEWSVTVPRWVIEQILRPNKPAVRKIDPAYFDLNGKPMERVVARWAVAHRGYEPGPPHRMFAWRAFELSTMSEWRKFYPVLQDIVELNRLPDHILTLQETDRGVVLLIDVRPGHEREPKRWNKKESKDQPSTKRPDRAPRPDGLPDNIEVGDVNA
ncbi:Replication initiator protein A [Methylobacterium sp. 190mf]|uniref:replication initiator protein A n=1 Tax=Methylobacterium sp. 190mf TaxID=1761798 RepID=UPI00089EBA9A|nr:replication initiator protein A [Methylobacterium sp. 190mf]SEG71584.1 Replication initiator protein A [Methylobacterium sp. 190mf]